MVRKNCRSSSAKILFIVTYRFFAERRFPRPATSLGGVFFLQISKEALDFKKQFQNLCKVQNLCICGLLIALYVVMSFFNITISSFLEVRIGFLSFMAAGMFGGPVMGFAVGFLGDMLNCLVRGFAYFPGFSLSYGLVGAVSGIILYRSRINKMRAAACAFTEFLISVSLTSVWLYFMYGTPLKVLFTTRFIKCTLNFFVNCVIIYIFLEAFQKIVRTAMPTKK